MKRGWLPSSWTAETLDSIRVCDMLMAMEKASVPHVENAKSSRYESGTHSMGFYAAMILFAIGLVGGSTFLLFKTIKSSRNSDPNRLFSPPSGYTLKGGQTHAYQALDIDHDTDSFSENGVSNFELQSLNI